MDKLYSKDYQYLINRLNTERAKIINLRIKYYNDSDEVMIESCNKALEQNKITSDFIKKVDSELWEDSKL